ncbi:MAG: hypothetical protein C5B52_04455 [Bacteroidetes bacterium]|nr:MAG: hypothetical protein C5B52_04455 [Bacteroidota bacterium]
MKKAVIYCKCIGAMLVLNLLIPVILFAQDKIVVDKESVSSWLQRNWMIVALGVLVLILLIALVGRGNKSKRTTTTVTKDAGDRVKSVTTVKEE